MRGLPNVCIALRRWLAAAAKAVAGEMSVLILSSDIRSDLYDAREDTTADASASEIEASASDGGLTQSVDVALRGRKVAIEVDGPSHFYANRRGERTGGDRLREAILESHGWKVRDPRSPASPFFFFFLFPKKPLLFGRSSR